MNKRYVHYILAVAGSLLLIVVSCTLLLHRDDPLFDYQPDTTNLLPLPSSTDIETRKAVVYDPIFLEDGSKRIKGNKSTPGDRQDFRFVDLDDIRWHGVRVQEGDFRGVSMRTAFCDSTDFRNCDFRFADLRWTSFNHSRFDSARLSQSMLFRASMNDASLSNADLRGCNLFGLNGHRSNFRYCDFSNSLMKETVITDSDFTHSKAIKVIFLLSVLSGSKFDSTDFCYADFTGAGLEDASFIRSRLWGVSFKGAHLQYADFSYADLKDANFFGAELAETNFTGARNIPDYLQDMLIDGIATGIVLHQNNPE